MTFEEEVYLRELLAKNNALLRAVFDHQQATPPDKRTMADLILYAECGGKEGEGKDVVHVGH